MRIVVTGGRSFNKKGLLKRVLIQINPSEIAEGGCSGADLLARDWAINHGVPVVTFRADWDVHGKAAGPIRNREMLLNFKPDKLVAFPGGKGTENCIAEAEKLGIEVIRIKE